MDIFKKNQNLKVRKKMTATMKDLLESGVHFGHQKRKWNPKMKKYIFGVRNNIYIIDLQQTIRYLRKVYSIVKDSAAEGKTMLFVGTKRQAIDSIEESAKACNMPYVNYRWLGGILTNFDTIRKSIKKMEVIEKMEQDGKLDYLTKKEALILRRKKDKLKKYFNGIREMKSIPDMIFVVDTVKEHIVIKEAKVLGIPIVAPIDTNCDPDDVTYKIPSNDDAIRSVKLICKEMSDAMIEGKSIYEENKNAKADVSEEEMVQEEQNAPISLEEAEKNNTSKE
jgi:small subunit ribosomal protein S2